MRVAGWLFVLCTAVSALGVFLPSVELEIGGTAVSKRTSLSLYRANTDRGLARKLIAGYERSTRLKFGGAILAAIMPHTTGRTKDALDDATSAMGTLDGITDDDVKTAGTIFMIALWTFLAIHAVMGGLVFGELMNQSFRRRRIVIALVLAVLAAALAVGTCLLAREVVWQANDELGTAALGTGIGAYLSPIAALGGLGALITLLALQIRSTRALSGRRPA